MQCMTQDVQRVSEVSSMPTPEENAGLQDAYLCLGDEAGKLAVLKHAETSIAQPMSSAHTQLCRNVGLLLLNAQTSKVPD